MTLAPQGGDQAAYVASLLQEIELNSKATNSLLAAHARERLPHFEKLHYLPDERSSSWLGLPRGRGFFGWYRAVADQHFARRLAGILLPRQSRLAPANGVVAVVVGCGRHGISIAGEMLRRGCSVKLCDTDAAASSLALSRLADVLRYLTSCGMFHRRDGDHLLSRCSVAASIMDAVSDAAGSLIFIEAVPECVVAKRAVLGSMAAACVTKQIDPSRVLFCTNTLTLDVRGVTVAMPQAYAGRVVGARFLTPCWFVDEVRLQVEPARTGPLAEDQEVPPGSPSPPSAPSGALPPGAALMQPPAVQVANSLFTSLCFKTVYVTRPPCHDAIHSSPAEPPYRLTFEEAALHGMRQTMQCEDDLREERHALDMQAEAVKSERPVEPTTLAVPITDPSVPCMAPVTPLGENFCDTASETSTVSDSLPVPLCEMAPASIASAAVYPPPGVVGTSDQPFPAGRPLWHPPPAGEPSTGGGASLDGANGAPASSACVETCAEVAEFEKMLTDVSDGHL